MTRQKKERLALPQGRRKTSATSGIERSRGGKWSPDLQRKHQLQLSLATAECPDQGAVVGLVSRRRDTRAHAVPKASAKEQTGAPASMEKVVEALRESFLHVARNKGAPGPDGRSIEDVRKHLDTLLPALGRTLLEGTYHPGHIRRVWIPKSSGERRGLGIPDVVDRMVQEALRRVLEPEYEPRFHPRSHGFRPNRSCHTAIAQAIQELDDGYTWVVDLDLEKFFDRVQHQRLLARLSRRIGDKRVLQLIHRFLKAKVVMPDGVLVSTEEGVPQGGPLSPLLSNIVLDELDWELERRGHRFVRYADDCNVYVRSERSGQRVMASLCRFIERRLRLKVNAAKSAVSRPEERHFVGFTLYRDAETGEVDVGLSKRSKKRIDVRIKELTPRNWGGSLRACITRVNEYLLGWFGFFGICTGTQSERAFGNLDAHTRRRLRALKLHQWKRKRTRAKQLIQLGVKPKTAWRNVYQGRKSLWALSHSPAVDRALHNAYFAKRGLVSLRQKWREKHAPQMLAPTQLKFGFGTGDGRESGCRRVDNRRPEEPYVTSTSTVL